MTSVGVVKKCSRKSVTNESITSAEKTTVDCSADVQTRPLVTRKTTAKRANVIKKSVTRPVLVIEGNQTQVFYFIRSKVFTHKVESRENECQTTTLPAFF